MGAANKRKTGRKGNSSKTKTGSQRKINAKKNDKSSLIKNEIKLILILAVMVLFELSAFGLCGKLGTALSFLLFGISGLTGYIFPVLLFIGLTYLILYISDKRVVFKFVTGVICFLFVCAFIQLLTNINSELNLITLFLDSANGKNGGGVFGGLIALVLYLATGKIGAYLIVIVVVIISIILLTEKSLFKGVKEGGKKAYKKASEDVEKLKESSEERLAERSRIREQRRTDSEEKENMRMFNKSKGVPINLRVNEELIVNDDMKEIQLKDINFDENENQINDIQVEQKNLFEDTKTEKDSLKETQEMSPDIHSVDESNYKFPPKTLLTKPVSGKRGTSNQELSETAAKLQQILANFGVKVTITDVSMGPSVTRYELQPEMGTKVSRITALADDIKLNLAAADIRIEAPIPGKAAVGIEVPNNGRDQVLLRELLEAPELKNHPSKIAFPAGKDISGKVVVADISKMPHMLVAGTTGSGKSVFMNSIIMSILYRAKPSEVRMLIIDPKVVEFGVYNDIPHLLHPVITDPKNAAAALNWAVAEMTRRYQLLAENNVRDFKSYNSKVEASGSKDSESANEKMPQIIIVIDELADLMMVAAKTVEESICRLAQLARAAGIHLIIATQRPSVDVVTGLIKANVPSRVALLVSSGIDSRTIIDMNGAEKLLGNGDMLFYPSGYIKPVRVQGAFVSEGEVSNVVEFLKKNAQELVYDESITEHINSNTGNISTNNSGGMEEANENIKDQYFADAGRLIIEMDKASSSMLQRRFRIGFNRAARIIDELYEYGVIGPEEGSKPRKVIMNMEEFEELILTFSGERRN